MGRFGPLDRIAMTLPSTAVGVIAGSTFTAGEGRELKAKRDPGREQL